MVLFASWALPNSKRGRWGAARTTRTAAERGAKTLMRESTGYTQWNTHRTERWIICLNMFLSIGCNKVDCWVSGFSDMPWPCCFAQVFCANMWRNCWPGSVWPKDQGEPSNIEGPQTHWEITMMRCSDCIWWRFEQEMDWRIQGNLWFETEIDQNLNIRDALARFCVKRTVWTTCQRTILSVATKMPSATKVVNAWW